MVSESCIKSAIRSDYW